MSASLPRARRGSALLARLLVSANEPLTSTQLIEDVWDGRAHGEVHLHLRVAAGVELAYDVEVGSFGPVGIRLRGGQSGWLLEGLEPVGHVSGTSPKSSRPIGGSTTCPRPHRRPSQTVAIPQRL